MIKIEFPGEPRGKGRPRSRVAWTKQDKPFVAIYTDAETRKYEEDIAWAAKAIMRASPPLGGPLVVWIEAYFPVPQSWSRPKRDAALAGVIRPIGKPDFDNIAKSACDALKGIVWMDDSRIVEAHVTKKYSERPVLKISVEELDVWTDDAIEQRRQISLI
jgi:Holliday junction resolvase RusA-like endonuclease